MWNYVKRYLRFALLAALFMVGEVMMDLVQPGIMSRIVDDGVLGLNNNGAGDLNLIWTLGVQMIGLVLFGVFCGALNNAFVHLIGQNIGNEMRKDCFRNIMTFSFPRLDRFGTGSLVTRVTNDITKVQTFVSTFVRGMIRTALLMFGSMYFMFRLNRDFGLIVLWAFPFIVGCLAFCLWKANPLFSRLQAQLDAVNSIMQEDISGIRMIKACIRESYEKLRFGKANDGLINTQLQVLVLFAFMNPVVNGLMYMVVAVILLAGSFEVRDGGATPGTIMAATGCGKTSLIHLIPRFYDVTSGTVLVDGVDVREYRQKALREKIAVTLQKSELFTETIYENIGWGISSASEEDREKRVKEAAVIAQAEDFISSSPKGCQTAVAERGMSLSGGQKQRLSIARAVVKEA